MATGESLAWPTSQAPASKEIGSPEQGEPDEQCRRRAPNDPHGPFTCGATPVDGIVMSEEDYSARTGA